VCGSSVSKALNTTVKVATLGLVDMEKDVPKAPGTPDMPKAPGAAPTAQSPDVLAAREDEKKRRALAAGQNSTILTGPEGLSGAATTGQKTLLGA
jgi:hypothetical protein